MTAKASVLIVRRELPHGEVTVRAVSGGLSVPGADTIIACAAITVSIEYPEASHGVRAETLTERRGEG